LLANIEASEQGGQELSSLSAVPGVDWAKAVTNLKDALDISWGGLARRLGVHYDQVTRLRRGKRRAGYVMADRIIGLAIEEEILASVFEGIVKKESPRSRFIVPLPS